jgi:hypothetical protein
MADAANQLTQIAPWIKLFDYLNQKTRALGLGILATGAVVQELGREAECILPYRFKYVDEPDGDWHLEGPPVGYLWPYAVFDWPAASAYWPARDVPGLGPLPELRIYSIEVVVLPSSAAAPAVAKPDDRRTAIRLDAVLIQLVEAANAAAAAPPEFSSELGAQEEFWRQQFIIPWRRREDAADHIDSIIESGALKPWLRLVDGARFDLTRRDWRTNAFRRDIIISGIWRDAAGGLPEYNGAPVMLDDAAFEVWRDECASVRVGSPDLGKLANSVSTEPSQPEPSQPEPSQPEPSQPEPSQPEPSESEPSPTEPSPLEPSPPALIRPSDFKANKLWRTVELIYELRATAKFKHATEQVLCTEVSRRYESETKKGEGVSLRTLQDAEAKLKELLQQH